MSAASFRPLRPATRRDNDFAVGVTWLLLRLDEGNPLRPPRELPNDEAEVVEAAEEQQSASEVEKRVRWARLPWCSLRCGSFP